MSIASQLGREITTKAGKRLAENSGKKAVDTVSKAAADKLSKQVVEKAAKKASSKVAGDVLIRSTAKAVESANPLLDATLAKIQAEIKAKGAFTAHVIDELQLAVTQTNTPAEALHVSALAKKLAFKNDINKGAILTGLQRAIDKSSLSEEAIATLKAVVKTRQECYALFSLAQKHGITFNAVEKLMRSGEENAMSEAAIHVIPRPVWGPKPPHFRVGTDQIEKTLAEKIVAVARYLNAALS